MGPKGKAEYERYVAACNGVWPHATEHDLMRAWEHLSVDQRAQWEAVADAKSDRHRCHLSLLPEEEQ